jgi:hypothetical protein
VQHIPFEQNEAAVSLSLVKFGAYPDVQYLLVGVAKDLQLAPRQAAGGFIYTYRVSRGNQVCNLSLFALYLEQVTHDDPIPTARIPMSG